MSKTIYVNLDNITELQIDIMTFIALWVKEKKEPVPQKVIVLAMEGIKDFTTVNALNTLLKKGYIRRAYTLSNTTKYVQLRTI